LGGVREPGVWGPRGCQRKADSGCRTTKQESVLAAVEAMNRELEGAGAHRSWVSAWGRGDGML